MSKKSRWPFCVLDGLMVSEMDGCNGRFKDYYGGWMKCQKNPVGPFVS